MLAAGFEDSSVRVWSLTTQRLRAMKSGDALSDIDKETGRFTLITSTHSPGLFATVIL